MARITRGFPVPVAMNGTRDAFISGAVGEFPMQSTYPDPTQQHNNTTETEGDVFLLGEAVLDRAKDVSQQITERVRQLAGDDRPSSSYEP
jgi:hypothetical protein